MYLGVPIRPSRTAGVARLSDGSGGGETRSVSSHRKEAERGKNLNRHRQFTISRSPPLQSWAHFSAALQNDRSWQSERARKPAIISGQQVSVITKTHASPALPNLPFAVSCSIAGSSHFSAITHRQFYTFTCCRPHVIVFTFSSHKINMFIQNCLFFRRGDGQTTHLPLRPGWQMCSL